jgi:DNA repair protein RadC
VKKQKHRDAVPIQGHRAPEDLALEELLAVVAGTGAVAEAIAPQSITELAEQSPCELHARGVPPAAARRLACAFELGRRVGSRRLARGEPMRTSQQLADAFMPRLGRLNVEQTWLVLLDAKNRVIREVMLSQGTLTSSLVHPREVFRVAIRAAAVGFALVHNHPSGDPEPSPDDEALTRRLVAVGELVGIKLLEHLVVTDGAYVSLLERGLVLP